MFPFSSVSLAFLGLTTIGIFAGPVPRPSTQPRRAAPNQKAHECGFSIYLENTEFGGEANKSCWLRCTGDGRLRVRCEGRQGEMVLSSPALAALKDAVRCYVSNPPVFLRIWTRISPVSMPIVYHVSMAGTTRVTLIDTSPHLAQFVKLSTAVEVAASRSGASEEMKGLLRKALRRYLRGDPWPGTPWGSTEPEQLAKHFRSVVEIPNGTPEDLVRRMFAQKEGPNTSHAISMGFRHIGLHRKTGLGDLILRGYRKRPPRDLDLRREMLCAILSCGSSEGFVEMDRLLRKRNLETHLGDEPLITMHDYIDPETLRRAYEKAGAAPRHTKRADRKAWRWIVANRHRLVMVRRTGKFVLRGTADKIRPESRPAQGKVAGPSAQRGDASRERGQAAQLRRVLAENRVSFYITDLPLRDTLQMVGAAGGIELEVRWTALAVVGVRKGTLVTVRVRGVSLADTLDEVLSRLPGGLATIGYAVVGDKVVVSTREDLRGLLKRS